MQFSSRFAAASICARGRFDEFGIICSKSFADTCCCTCCINICVVYVHDQLSTRRRKPVREMRLNITRGFYHMFAV